MTNAPGSGATLSRMSFPAGTPSDQVPPILEIGRSGVEAIFLSLSARHPDGRDADYLRWHTFDCRPEQHRLAALRASMRLVSTPACRSARAASRDSYDEADHVMAYLFSDVGALKSFADLTAALRDAGRKPYLDGRDGEELRVLPQLEQAVYHLEGLAAAPRVKVGADVLPWLPQRGFYLLVERGGSAPTELIEVPGVAGAWWGTTVQPDAGVKSFAADAGSADFAGDATQRLTYCFLDDEPVATAERLRPLLEKRWADTGATPLLAAPFHPVLGYDYDRFLP